MNYSIYHNLKNDKQYKASTGFSQEEFEYLFSFFDKLYYSKQENPYNAEKTPLLKDSREALFFILHYYKAYPSLQNLGLYFGFSEASASTYLERIKPFLKASYQASGIDMKRIFKDQTEFDTIFAEVEDLFIDVSEISLERPQKAEIQKENYSGKKNNIL
jgi:hypothetical protein